MNASNACSLIYMCNVFLNSYPFAPYTTVIVKMRRMEQRKKMRFHLVWTLCRRLYFSRWGKISLSLGGSSFVKDYCNAFKLVTRTRKNISQAILYISTYEWLWDTRTRVHVLPYANALLLLSCVITNCDIQNYPIIRYYGKDTEGLLCETFFITALKASAEEYKMQSLS